LDFPQGYAEIQAVEARSLAAAGQIDSDLCKKRSRA
jgi:hypothetical protein